MNLLEVRHLKKYYATQKAVDDISFTIAPGAVFGLLGPNGAGKTTLLRMITGIFYPDEGEIIFEGKPFKPEEDILRIGYMPEERGLYKKMKIGEQAMYLAQLKGLKKADASAKIKDWFTRFGMESWWGKKVEDLSKGMQQKLQFVITVLHEPSLIILDEPFSGLDPVNSNLIKEEIYKLAKKGCTIIFSTHRMEQVEEICDQIILVNKGRKVLDGPVDEVKRQHKENLFHIGLNQIPAGIDSRGFEVVRTEEKGLVIKMMEGASTNELLQYFISRDAYITEFHEILPSLNEIFIKQVEGTAMSRQFQKVQ
ncbi:MAG: ABC transporter ATP-binding protein [Gemmatimonadaceae bacterium]|nr:ABC transporter ATP-binding protein [Chitinophagaceae bacterium]